MTQQKPALGKGEIRVGAHALRILRQGSGYAGIIVGRSAERVTGATYAEVEAALRAMIAKDTPGFIGLDGARRRFLRLFPRGFADPAFIGDSRHGERAYKLAAVQFLAERLPLDSVGSAAGQAEVARQAFQRTNLVDPFTKAKLGDVLRGPNGDRFVELAAWFARGQIAEACRAVRQEFKDDGVANWISLTYLPFLWCPGHHMVLKPSFTRGFAERIGHPFQHAYDSAPNPDTYSALMDMAAELGRSLSDLAPRDMIDLHSFMWAVMDYPEQDGPE